MTYDVFGGTLNPTVLRHVPSSWLDLPAFPLVGIVCDPQGSVS